MPAEVQPRSSGQRGQSLGEALHRAKNETEARNTAVRLMEDFIGKDSAMLKERMIGSLEKSDFFGKEIGATYTITGRSGAREARPTEPRQGKVPLRAEGHGARRI